jgi:hypothetical protein
MEFEAKHMQYGAWMLATRRVSTLIEPRRFVPREPDRGGWSGRGGLNQARKRSSQDASLDEEEETGESGENLLKSIPMEEVEEGNELTGVKKRLDLEDDNEMGTKVPASDSGKGLDTPPPPLAM